MMTPEQAASDSTTVHSDTEGAPTTQENAASTETPVANEADNTGATQAKSDPEFDSKVQRTHDGVVGTFQKLLNSVSEKPEPGAKDDTIDTQLRNTKGQVVGTFQKLWSKGQAAVGGTPAQASDEAGVGTDAEIPEGADAGAPTSKGTGARPFSKDDDDTIENQMRNRTAEVVGTFKGLGTVFQQAGQKLKDSTSSQK